MKGVPRQNRGYLQDRMETPGHDRGYPPGQDRGYPLERMGYPQERMGYPSGQDN